MTKQIELDHIDIVVTHACNMKCRHCVDPLVHTDNTAISLNLVEKFLSAIRSYTDKNLSVLLLGGEPSVIEEDKLIQLTNIAHDLDFRISMSTNGINREKLVRLLPFFDWLQITMRTDKDINFWKNCEYPNHINAKLACDNALTYEKLMQFSEVAQVFGRRSVTMYFDGSGKELCRDERIQKFLDDPCHTWNRNGSYLYMFHNGIRYKRAIPNVTNIADEPSIPKLYPNGNYNKTWCNEKLDDYLGFGWN